MYSDFKNNLLCIALLSAFFGLLACSEQMNANSQDKEIRGLTKSGYPYIHHIKNKGKRAKVGDEIAYHQIVAKNDTLLQSTHFYGPPRKTVMPPRDSIASPPPPHYDALFLMAPGDSLTVFQLLTNFKASELPPGVTNHDTFIYHLTVYAIKDAAEVAKEKAAIARRAVDIVDSMQTTVKAYLAGQLDNQITTSESGLKYIIHNEGSGKSAEPGKFIDVHYAGFLQDGSNFDNSWKKGQPYTFRVGRGLVIKGWDEALPMLKEGGKATLFIPHTLAYGVAGQPPTIPERAELIFYVELEAVRF